MLEYQNLLNALKLPIGQSAYAASKGGVVSLTLPLARGCRRTRFVQDTLIRHAI